MHSLKEIAPVDATHYYMIHMGQNPSGLIVSGTRFFKQTEDSLETWGNDGWEPITNQCANPPPKMYELNHADS